MTPLISPVLTFITFTGLALRRNNALDISTAFTSLSLLALLYKPLGLVIGVLPLIASAMACFGRIQAYFNKPSWEDTRILRLISPSSKEDETWSAPPSTGDQIELVQLDNINGYQDFIATMHGRFQWGKNTEKFIDMSEFKIRRQTFTLLLGPVGCGKSTVLKGLLGELPGFEGSITAASRGMAFCDQVPWLPNGTFRDIILGKFRFDQVWYQSVISACALEEDLRQWPQGDRTLIGSKGTILSGGQKHRTVSV